jgi:predicted metal-binding membrane protein
MIDIAREVARVRYPMLAISACAWIVLAALPDMHVESLAICSGGPTTADLLSQALATHSPTPLVVGCALMLVAMMSPLVIPAIHHVRFTSLARRRARSIALFMAGYASVWMMWGAMLMGVAFVAQALASGSFIPALVGCMVACVWQISPLKQLSLNKCYLKPPLRAFGLGADLDTLRFGWMHGLWCAASCSVLMLLPMLLPVDHLAAMAVVAVFVYCERLEDPAPPVWKLRGLSKTRRMMAARIRVRWRRLLAACDGYLREVSA